MIERLNQQFALTNSLVFIRDNNGFPKACLTSAARHKLEVFLHGAQVCSWTNPNGEELLFMSSKAVFKRGQAVRGGIPIIFPQFGKGELPSHGFARICQWDVKETKMLSESEPSITFKLEDCGGLKEKWPHPFVLELTVSLTEKVRMRLKVYNCGTTPFYFFAGFHNYFRVADINRAAISGLKGITLMNALKQKSYEVQNLDPIVLDESTDKIYLNAPNEARIRDQLSSREFVVKKENIRDMVVWNPWESGSKSLSDLSEHDYLSFVCVEPAIVNSKITLNPREKYELSQELSVA